MVVIRPRSCRLRDTESGGQATRDPSVAARGADWCAGSVADPRVGDGCGDRIGQSAGHDQAAGRGNWGDQDPRSWFSGGQLLIGMARAELAGKDFLVGWIANAPMSPGRCLLRWRDWAPPPRPGWPGSSPTGSVGLPTTTRGNAGGACSGQLTQTATVLAADLMAANEDFRGHAAALLGRASAALPTGGAGRGGSCRALTLATSPGNSPGRALSAGRVRHRRPPDRAAVAAAWHNQREINSSPTRGFGSDGNT